MKITQKSMSTRTSSCTVKIIGIQYISIVCAHVCVCVCVYDPMQIPKNANTHMLL